MKWKFRNLHVFFFSLKRHFSSNFKDDISIKGNVQCPNMLTKLPDCDWCTAGMYHLRSFGHRTLPLRSQTVFCVLFHMTETSSDGLSVIALRRRFTVPIPESVRPHLEDLLRWRQPTEGIGREVVETIVSTLVVQSIWGPLQHDCKGKGFEFDEQRKVGQPFNACNWMSNVDLWPLMQQSPFRNLQPPRLEVIFSKNETIKNLEFLQISVYNVADLFVKIDEIWHL